MAPTSVRKRRWPTPACRGRGGGGGFAETTGQSSLKPAKPISFVLGRFYHGAVYHRLPRQCRCCSHCEPRGNVVLTYIPPPTPSSNGPAEKIDRTQTPFRCSRPLRGQRSPIPQGQSLLIANSREAFLRFRRAGGICSVHRHRYMAAPMSSKWSDLFSLL